MAKVLVVMGVSGSGKSTVARALAELTGWTFQEGDDLHPAGNVAKMKAGHPLTDEDRWPWLAAIGSWIDGCIAADQPGVVTCSALKRSYRDVLRRPDVVFVHLVGSPAEIASRLGHRTGHFMPKEMLESQLATLEPLSEDENGLLVEIGPAATGPTSAELAAQIVQMLKENK